MEADDEPEADGLLHALRERTGVIVGVVGLIAWCVMLWAMFGDVH